jgi:hypothetical protein
MIIFREKTKEIINFEQIAYIKLDERKLKAPNGTEIAAYYILFVVDNNNIVEWGFRDQDIKSGKNKTPTEAEQDRDKIYQLILTGIHDKDDVIKIESTFEIGNFSTSFFSRLN